MSHFLKNFLAPQFLTQKDNEQKQGVIKMAATPSTFDISRLNQATVNLEHFAGDDTRPELSEDNLKLIFDHLKTNTVVTNLTLDYQRIGQHGMASKIAQMLTVNSTITHLSLVNTDLDVAGVQLIAEALKTNTTLESLELGANGLADDSAIAIAEALKLNETLRILELSENRIDDEGAKAIAEALKINRTLTDLILEDNRIGELGAAALSEALDTNHELTGLSMDENMSSVDNAFLQEFNRKCRVNLDGKARWGVLDGEPPARASRAAATELCVLASRRGFGGMTLRAPTEAGAACGGGGGGSGAEVDPRISGTTRPFEAASVGAVAEGVAADKADGPTPD